MKLDSSEARKSTAFAISSGSPNRPIGTCTSRRAARSASLAKSSFSSGVLTGPGHSAMTRELGVQFARDGIRVNALCPGPVNTPLLKELFAKDAERAARRLVHVPMGRFGEPEEMANAVLFLASDESSFMTASTFLVDGGISGAYVTPL